MFVLATGSVGSFGGGSSKLNAEYTARAPKSANCGGGLYSGKTIVWSFMADLGGYFMGIVTFVLLSGEAFKARLHCLLIRSSISSHEIDKLVS